ncbi:hypothetical protein HMPREF1624_01892 [Sporothrix schenckii ATCC 58251]|uniref:Uncharacterized protein n=1 Tax=Sporothrix schenckii (strain ATCC 58251 / de Perez 2211183) TaxID=1391915 RepID=U7Q0F2_SPOS1|nr:hypothetical protein HMPREF1624_01892 [Sporothrix schenckii ATCC 58251]
MKRARSDSDTSGTGPPTKRQRFQSPDSEAEKIIAPFSEPVDPAKIQAREESWARCRQLTFLLAREVNIAPAAPDATTTNQPLASPFKLDDQYQSIRAFLDDEAESKKNDEESKSDTSGIGIVQPLESEDEIVNGRDSVVDFQIFIDADAKSNISDSNASDNVSGDDKVKILETRQNVAEDLGDADDKEPSSYVMIRPEARSPSPGSEDGLLMHRHILSPIPVSLLHKASDDASDA